MARPNSIMLFSEPELRAALMLVGTPESAAAASRQLYALPPEEQIHLTWQSHTLLLLACVSDDLARRVRDLRQTATEDRERAEAEQRSFCERIRAQPAPSGRIAFHLSDVVHDTREDTAFMRAFRRARTGEETGRNYIGLFTRPELQAALDLCGDAGAAAAVAAEVYALSPEVQSTLDWTDVALWLLSSAAPQLAERVAATFGDTAERMEHIRAMQDAFRELIDSGELGTGRVAVRRETVVRAAEIL